MILRIYGILQEVKRLVCVLAVQDFPRKGLVLDGAGDIFTDTLAEKLLKGGIVHIHETTALVRRKADELLSAVSDHLVLDDLVPILVIDIFGSIIFSVG